MKWLKRILYVLGGLALALVLFLALAIGWLWFQHAQVVTLPAPMGPYHVAHVIYDWKDTKRQETLAPTNAPRELMVDVWYPTDTPGTETAPYMPPAWLAARQADYGIWGLFLVQDLNAIRTHSYANAPLSDAESKFPVILFIPGLGPIAADYTALTEDLASHGYIVAAPTPTYSSSLVVFDDGRIATSTPAGNVDDNASYEQARETLDKLIPVWADDASFVLDQLTALNQNDSSHRFTARLDLSKVAIAGHSFGGATAAEVLTRDPRFQAGVNLDGYFYGAAPQKGFDRPFLTLWSDNDPTDANWQLALQDVHSLYTKLPQQDAYQFAVHGAHHFNFTDVALEYAPIYQLKGALGTINGVRGTQITRAYVGAFMDRYLKGKNSKLLDTPSPDFPQVEKLTP